MLHGNAAQFKQAADGVLDQVVRAGSAGGDADGDFARRQPIRASRLPHVCAGRNGESALSEIHLGGVLDEVSRQLGFAHLRQVRGVGGIVAADHQQQIQRFAQQFFAAHPAGPGSRRRWYRKNGNVVRLRPRRTSVSMARLQPALHFLGFAAEHGGLVGHADGLQMHIGIESFRIGAFELFQKLRFVAAVDDVIADVIGFREREHDQIMAAAVGGRLRTGGLGFFVPGLAVNDAGDASPWNIGARVSKRSSRRRRWYPRKRQPFSSSFARVATSVPNAGMITTSSSSSSSIVRILRFAGIVT